MKLLLLSHEQPMLSALLTVWQGWGVSHFAWSLCIFWLCLICNTTNAAQVPDPLANWHVHKFGTICSSHCSHNLLWRGWEEQTPHYCNVCELSIEISSWEVHLMLVKQHSHGLKSLDKLRLGSMMATVQHNDVLAHCCTVSIVEPRRHLSEPLRPCKCCFTNINFQQWQASVLTAPWCISNSYSSSLSQCRQYPPKEMDTKQVSTAV